MHAASAGGARLPGAPTMPMLGLLAFGSGGASPNCTLPERDRRGKFCCAITGRVRSQCSHLPPPFLPSVGCLHRQPEFTIDTAFCAATANLDIVGVEIALAREEVCGRRADTWDVDGRALAGDWGRRAGRRLCSEVRGRDSALVLSRTAPHAVVDMVASSAVRAAPAATLRTPRFQLGENCQKEIWWEYTTRTRGRSGSADRRRTDRCTARVGVRCGKVAGEVIPHQHIHHARFAHSRAAPKYHMHHTRASLRQLEISVERRRWRRRPTVIMCHYCGTDRDGQQDKKY